ncbi:MAG: endolytic transglycosylase MltG [Paracoccaceae bacterium]
MWKALASNAITFLIVILFLLGGVILWGQTQYNAEGPLDQQICVRVPSGGSMSRVSRDLVAEGAISNGAIFRVGADYTDKTSQLKAGSFLVPAGASMAQITDIITRGGASTCGTEIVYRIGVTRASVQLRALDPATSRYVEEASYDPAEEEAPEALVKAAEAGDVRFRVALAEGVTSWQVAENLKSIDILAGEIGDLPAEGSLAPDSYEIRRGTARADLIAKMQSAQQAILAAAWSERDDNLPVKTPEEALILASLIEKETGVAEERRQVASVFVNRLRQGIKLQTDPAVIYGITKGQGVLGRGIRQSELRRETPWNTYVIPALPPTPIANPGRASIEAALNPDTTPYIFFVADGTGGHAFAETLAEHNANVAKWRQIEAERAKQSE